jgi:hypothetical protein
MSLGKDAREAEEFLWRSEAGAGQRVEHTSKERVPEWSVSNFLIMASNSLRRRKVPLRRRARFNSLRDE